MRTNQFIKSTLPKFALCVVLLNSLSYSQGKHSHKHQIMNDSTMNHRQHMIHSNSPIVMPFEMNSTTHYFLKNINGGTLSIKVKDKNDSTQIGRIRNHLIKEQKLFSNNDFRDPKTLHGKNMPGLKTLSESGKKLDVSYLEIPEGAQLLFESKDSNVVNAIHKSFDAQLKDHGSDAKSMTD